MPPTVLVPIALTPHQAEALLEAATMAEKQWNHPKWAFEKPGYPVRLALDEAIEELREALK